MDEPYASYAAALEVWPDYLPAIQWLAGLTARAGRKNERLAGWLDAIAIRAESANWREWAANRQAGLRP